MEVLEIHSFKECKKCLVLHTNMVKEYLHLLFAEDVIHGLDVPVGEVHDVDVVPVPGAVPGVVVVPVHGDLLPPPDGHLGDVGHQVVGDPQGVLANVP